MAKKGNKWRGVLDFRALNDATVTDAQPLPRIEDILTGQGRKYMFSVMDLKDAFHQVPLHVDSRPYTCCSTPRGTKQWYVVVMGLKNGVAIFQRVIDYCLRDVSDVADPYVDDIIIGTMWQGGEEATLRAHDEDVRRVMDQLKVHKLVADIKKCRFFVTEVEFCGHILGGGKRRPAPGKLMALEKWEAPKTVTALRGFLGFTNYYSTYVKDYAAYAAPLLDLLKLNRIDGKKGSKKAVKFGPKEHESFESLKRELLRGLELQTVNPDKPFILRVDASDRAVGAALEQMAEDGFKMPTATDALTRRTVPVAFCSRKLTAGQVRTWSPREKETYAIVLALQKWSNYIGLQPVLILTDHKSLEVWATETLDTPSGPAGRLARWHETLSKFDLQVTYIPGKDNVVADALCRWAYPASKAFADVSIHGSVEDDEAMRAIIEEERREERSCRVLWIADAMGALHKEALRRIEAYRSLPPSEREAYVQVIQAFEQATVAVTTRSGRATTPGVPGAGPPP